VFATVLLAMSWWLMGRQLHRTLPADVAGGALRDLAGQYALAVAGCALLAVALGWTFAGRALAPVRRIADTARRVSDGRLDERIRLEGPPDELHALGDTLDTMLDRLQAGVEGQRRFVANASHELRTPLTVIRAEAEVTLSDPDATEAELREMGRVVIETTDRTEALLDGLLVLAMSTRGSRRHEPVDLVALGRRVAATAEPEALDAAIELRVGLAPATVRGDEPLLERLVANLVENAIRHNSPGGFADLSIRTRAGRAVVRVENGGPTIPPESLERLAEPFERLDRSLRRPGAGLGLSIVRAVAEAHGGTLHLAARDGGGLCAEVALPAASAAAGPAADAPAPASLALG
jgi:signal transduction histidine kinase